MLYKVAFSKPGKDLDFLDNKTPHSWETVMFTVSFIMFSYVYLVILCMFTLRYTTQIDGAVQAVDIYGVGGGRLYSNSVLALLNNIPARCYVPFSFA